MSEYQLFLLDTLFYTHVWKWQNIFSAKFVNDLRHVQLSLKSSDQTWEAISMIQHK